MATPDNPNVFKAVDVYVRDSGTVYTEGSDEEGNGKETGTRTLSFGVLPDISLEEAWGKGFIVEGGWCTMRIGPEDIPEGGDLLDAVRSVQRGIMRWLAGHGYTVNFK